MKSDKNDERKLKQSHNPSYFLNPLPFIFNYLLNCFGFINILSVVTSSTVMKSSKSSLLSRPLVSLSGTIFVEFSKNKTSLDGENFNS